MVKKVNRRENQGGGVVSVGFSGRISAGSRAEAGSGVGSGRSGSELASQETSLPA